MIPAAPIDAEAYVLAVLKLADPLTERVADRIGTRLPDAFPSSGPSIRITLVSLSTSPEHSHRQRAHVQVHGYGPGPNTEPEAFEIAGRAYRALVGLPEARRTFDGIVCNAVDEVLPITSAIDQPTSTSGYRFSMVLSLHRTRA